MMKHLIRKWWFWGIIIILLLSMIVFFYNSTKNKGVGSAGISLDEFKKIELGMGEMTVSRIIDPNNEWADNNIYEKCCIEIDKSKGSHIYKHTYKYIGEKGGYALVTFEADYSNGDLFVLPEVCEKKQYNLK